jgi:RNase P protein component
MAKNAESLSSVRKKVTHTHELIATSHHEAGHTIYALLQFIMVYSVRVFPNKKNKRIEGFTHFYPLVETHDLETSPLLDNRLNAEVGFYYAGLAAEKLQYKLHSGSDRLPSVLYGSYQDLKSAATLIKDYQIASPGDKRRNYKKRIIRKVNRELKEYWGDVVIVAHSLFQRKRLSFSDLKNLLTKKSENKEFWKEHLKVLNNLSEKSPIDEKEFRSILSL